jgi:hypothetical protein
MPDSPPSCTAAQLFVWPAQSSNLPAVHPVSMWEPCASDGMQTLEDLSGRERGRLKLRAEPQIFHPVPDLPMRKSAASHQHFGMRKNQDSMDVVEKRTRPGCQALTPGDVGFPPSAFWGPLPTALSALSAIKSGPASACLACPTTPSQIFPPKLTKLPGPPGPQPSLAPAHCQPTASLPPDRGSPPATSISRLRITGDQPRRALVTAARARRCMCLLNIGCDGRLQRVDE